MATQIKNTVLETALYLTLKLGFYIFPVHSIGASGGCTCGGTNCHSSGKHPRTQNGHHAATRDESQIRQWFEFDFPNSNIGVKTGCDSNLFVVDVDVPDGEESLKQLEAEYGALPLTPISITGSGGRHFWFVMPQEIVLKSTVNLFGKANVDTRGEGGYIVVPPSLHTSGKPYIWDSECNITKLPLAQLPGTWIEVLSKGKTSQLNNNGKVQKSTTTKVSPFGNEDNWVVSALKNLSEGNRHRTFFRIACRFRDHMTREELFSFLHLYAQCCNFDVTELARLIQDVYLRYPNKNEGEDAEEAAVVLEAIHFHDRPEPEPIPYVVHRMFPKGFVSLIHGPGGVGKSYFVVLLGSHIAKGLPFLGLPSIKQNVLLVDYELSPEVHTGRAYAVARGMDYDLPIEGLYYTNCNAPLDKTLDEIKRLVREHNIDVIIIDSFGPAGGIDPESGSDVIKLLQKLVSLNLSIILLDHEAKPQSGSKGPRTPFGSVYKTNLARSVFQMTKVDSDDSSSTISMRCTKNNFDATDFQIGYKMIFDKDDTQKSVVRIIKEDLSNAVFAETISGKERVLNALKILGEADRTALAEETGLKKDTVTNILTKIKDQINVVRKDGNTPFYALINSSEEN